MYKLYVCLVALLLCSLPSFGSYSNWVASISGIGGDCIIRVGFGCLPDATSGIDHNLALGYDETPNNYPPMPSEAYVAAEDVGRKPFDFREPGSHTWNFEVFAGSDYQGSMALRFRFANIDGIDIENFGVNAADYMLPSDALFIISGPGFYQAFGPGQPLPRQIDITGIPNVKANAPVIFTVYASGVPEPSSLAALACCLAGLAGVVRRRRKA